MAGEVLVTGSVFNDDDGSGTKNGSELGRENVRAYLDLNLNGRYDDGASAEPSDLTDASGNFEIVNPDSGLEGPSGRVSVRVDFNAGSITRPDGLFTNVGAVEMVDDPNLPANFQQATEVQDIESADFNGDGVVDLAFYQGGNFRELTILLADPVTGRYRTSSANIFSISISDRGAQLASGDVNGDGAAELVVIEPNVLLSGQNSVRVYQYNAGTENFQVIKTLQVRNPRDALLADIDSNFDGDELMVLSGSPSQVTVFKSNASTLDTSLTISDAGNLPVAFTSGMFNADNFLDLALADSTGDAIVLLEGTAAGSFQFLKTISGTTAPESIAAGRLEGVDSHTDLAVVNGDEVSIFKGDGAGNFTKERDLLNDPFSDDKPSRVAAGDMDGDGDSELVFTLIGQFDDNNNEGNFAKFELFENDGGVLQNTFVGTQFGVGLIYGHPLPVGLSQLPGQAIHGFAIAAHYQQAEDPDNGFPFPQAMQLYSTGRQYRVDLGNEPVELPDDSFGVIPPIVADLSVSTQGDENGPTDIVYTVTLSENNNTGSAITFDLDDLMTGSATSGQDYTAIAAGAQITVAPSSSTGTFNVAVTDDTRLESTETVTVQISNPSHPRVAVATATATANIAENDVASANLSVSTQGSETGPLDIVYAVSLDKFNETGSAITFEFDDLMTGTATSGQDYTAIGSDAVITIAQGANSGTVTVPVINDVLLESDTETLLAQISSPSDPAVLIGSGSATATITDNETATASLAVANQGDENGPENVAYTVTLSRQNDTGSAITFDVDDLMTGSAISGDDYTAIASDAVVAIAAGESVGTITVPVIDDELLEQNSETLTVQIANPSHSDVTITASTATADITDNDLATANLSVTNQGDEIGPANIVYSVTLSKENGTGAAISFDFDDLMTGTATSGDDFVAIANNATISVAPGQTTGTFTVSVTNDGLLEADTETLHAQISNPTFGDVTIGTGQATAFITDDDVAIANLSVASDGDEDGPSNVVYEVQLTKTNDTGSAITFDLNDLLSGTASSGNDYTSIAEDAVIRVDPGESTGSVTIPVIDDLLLEADQETLVLQIANPSNTDVIIATASATATIVDDEVAQANLSVTAEGNELGPEQIVYSVTLTRINDTGSAITFDLDDLLTGSATSGADYLAVADDAVISVAVGSDTGTLSVPVTDDDFLESTETMVVQIANPSSQDVTIDTAITTANILSEDEATADLSVTTQGDEIGPADIVYTVTLSKRNDTGSEITFDLDDLNTGTATSGSDYTAVAADAVVRIPVGESVGMLSLPVTNDALLEASIETVIAQISNPSFPAVTIGDGQATANIADDDMATANLVVSTQGNETGPTDIVYTVTLSKHNQTESAITFDLDDLMTGSASSGDDYTAIASDAQVTVAVDSDSGTFILPVTDDDRLEMTETVDVQISNASDSRVTIATASATADLFDNDGQGTTANFSVAMQGSEEGPANIVFAVTLNKNNDTGSAITFDFEDLSSGSATSGSDYSAIADDATISVTPGENTGTLVVPVIDDANLESLETLDAQISNPSNLDITIVTSTASATITDNDLANASLSVTTQGNETGPIDIVYTVELDKDNDTASAIDFDVQDLLSGSATPDADYTAIAANTQITIAPGSNTGSLTVSVTDDDEPELNESVVVQISSPSNPSVTVTTASATATIIDDDPPQVTVTVAPSAVDEEGSGVLTYTFTRSGPTDDPLTVSYVVSGTATPGDDYDELSDQIIIAADTDTATFDVDPINDGLTEPEETIVVTLSDSSEYEVGDPGEATGRINASISDTITLEGADEVFSLSQPSQPLEGVLTIDIRGTGDNTLELDADVIRTVTPGSTLRVIADKGDEVIFDEGWEYILASLSDTVLVRRFEQEGAVLLIVGPQDFTNPMLRHDVDGSGEITARDALVIINELKRRSFSDPETNDVKDVTAINTGAFLFFDVSGEGQITALDALRVINALARILNSNNELVVAQWLPTPTGPDAAPAETRFDGLTATPIATSSDDRRETSAVTVSSGSVAERTLPREVNESLETREPVTLDATLADAALTALIDESQLSD